VLALGSALAHLFKLDTVTKVEIPGMGVLEFELHSKPDIWISDPIRRGEIFDPHVLTALRKLVRPGDALLDVGANIGWFSVIGSRLVGSTGQVWAVEPEPCNVGILRRNLRRNKCANVEVLPIAAGAMAEQASLLLSSDNQGDHRLSTNAGDGTSILVPVRPLDEVIGDCDVSIVKIDTQGSEVSALRGMQRIFKKNSRIRFILEFWPYGLAQCGASTEELLAALSWRDNFFWLISPDGAIKPLESEDVLNLSRTSLAPSTQAHADLIVISADDDEALLAVRELAS
jgi:FkbM family methyltransferase